MHRRLPPTAVLLLALVAAPAAAAPSWAPWEVDNAVGQFRAFLVVRQPGENRCYVKQSFHGDDGKMELIFDGDALTVVTPHIPSARWNATWWVDSGARQTLAHADIMAPNSFRLPADSLGDLRAGNYLNVRVTPEAGEPLSQTLSLLGFTAASRKLSEPDCLGAAEDTASDPAPAASAEPLDTDDPGDS